MSKIPTAREFILKNEDRFITTSVDVWLVEFAKLHVQAALEAASENVITIKDDNPDMEFWTIDKESILNSYSLKNIK